MLDMWLLAVLAIICGLVVAIFDVTFVMPALVWFVLAIALAVLNPGPVPFVRVGRSE